MNLQPLSPALMAAVWSGDMSAVQKWTQASAHAQALLARDNFAHGKRDAQGQAFGPPTDEAQALAVSADAALIAAAQINRGDIAHSLLDAGAFAGHADAKAWAWAIHHDNAPLACALSNALFLSESDASAALDAENGALIARSRLSHFPWGPIALAIERSSLAVLSSWRDTGLLAALPWEQVSAAMSVACRSKNGGIVDFFLDCGVELWDNPNNKRARALAIATDIEAALANPDISALSALMRPDRALSYGAVPLYMALAKANHMNPLRLDAIEIICAAIPWADLAPSTDIGHELMNCAGSAKKAPSLRIMLRHGAPANGFTWDHFFGAEAQQRAPDNAPRPWASIRGNAPLFAALTSGVSDAVTALMEHGADPGLDSEPDSPISFARKIPATNKSHETAQILIAFAEQRELRAISRMGDPAAARPRKPMSL